MQFLLTTCIAWLTLKSPLRVLNLGITFDSKMTMSPHITALCRTLNFSLWNISRIRRFVDQETCINAMRALILSKLDYGNALLSGCKVTDIARLQRIQNRAACIVFQVPLSFWTRSIGYPLKKESFSKFCCISTSR